MLKRCISISVILCMLFTIVSVCGMTSVSAATIVQEIGLSQTNPTRIRVACKPVSGATHYEIKYATNNTMNGAKIKNSTSNVCNFNSLTINKYYYFQARAYKLSGSTKKYLSNYSSIKGIYVQPNYIKVSSEIEYKIKNLPNKRVIQGFYLDTVDNCVYTTQVSPVYDNAGVKIREDTIISKCPINKNGNAVCESYIYIQNGGHGVIIQGYRDDNNKLRFFVGCDYNTTYGFATGVANIRYNEKYANKYDSAKGKFVNADGVVVKCPTKRTIGVDYKTTVFNSGANKTTFNKTRIRNVHKLLNADEWYSKFDFLRSKSGKNFITIKYYKNKLTYSRTLRVTEKLETLATTQSKATYFTKLTTTQLYNRKGERALVNNGWQSTGVYGSGTNPNIFVSGNIGFEGVNYSLSFIDIKANRAYNVKADKSGYIGEEEVEGIQVIGKKLYFAHKSINSADGARVITIQSFDLVV